MDSTSEGLSLLEPFDCASNPPGGSTNCREGFCAIADNWRLSSGSAIAKELSGDVGPSAIGPIPLSAAGEEFAGNELFGIEFVGSGDDLAKAPPGSTEAKN